MGEVYEFTRARERKSKPPVTFQELWNRAYLGATVQDVRKAFESAAQGILSIGFTSPVLMRDGSEEAEQFGSLQPVKGFVDTDSLIVRTHENFPNALMDEGIGRAQSLQLAAASIIAYASVLSWQRSLPKMSKNRLHARASQAGLLPRYPRLWHESAFDPVEVRVDSHVIAHRIAGRLALDASRIIDFDPVSKPPFPPHIAALADPLEAHQIRLLASAAKQGY